jgi:membrane protein
MKKVSLKGLWQVLKKTFSGFLDDKVPKLSAALAYYTVFSLGPLLIVIIYLCSIFFGREAVEGSIYSQMASFVGSDAALQIQDIVKSASLTNKGTISAIIGIITLIIGATTVFAEIQDSINTIWGLKPKPKQGMWLLIKTRLLSFGIVVSLGFLLLVSLSITALVEAFGNRLKAQFPDASVIVLYVINLLLTFGVVTLLFAVIFKVLPDAKIKWRDVWPGAIATAILFMIGKFLISFYIGASNIGSTYGTAGSLVILIVWIYYSSIILYFGAEFTKAYAVQFGTPIHPNAYAVVARTVEVEEGKKSIQESEKKADKEKEKAAGMNESRDNSRSQITGMESYPLARPIASQNPGNQYRVPPNRAIIIARKKPGILAVLGGLLLWYINSGEKYSRKN